MEKINTFFWYGLFTKSPRSVIDFCMDLGLIASERTCPKCGKAMNLVPRSDLSDGYQWMCRVRGSVDPHRCRKSIRAGSWFAESRLSLNTVLIMTHWFVLGVSQNIIVDELNVSSRTVCDWRGFFREVCLEACLNMTAPIGGEGLIVEMDECKFGKRMYNRGRSVVGKWVFKGIERGSGKCFFRVVEKRDKETLLATIETFVLPGTTLYSDLWKSYDCLEDEGFRHLSVNYSLSFKDSETGIHTNTIEGTWSGINRRLPSRTVGVDTHLFEYIWRKHHSNTYDKTRAFLEDVRRAYNPLEEANDDEEVKEEVMSEDETYQITESSQMMTDCDNMLTKVKEEVLSEDEIYQITETSQMMTDCDNMLTKVKEEVLSEDEACLTPDCSQAKTECDNVEDFKEDSFESDCSSLSEQTQLRTETTVPIEENPYSCPHCDHVTDQRCNLESHIKTSHGVRKSHFCPHCHYTAGWKSHLMQHISSVHDGKSLYSCSLCDYRAIKKYDLTSHINVVHRKERPYACPFCNYASSRKSTLNKHISSVHEGEKPFSCPHCEYTAAYKSNVGTHIASVHRGEKPYLCPHCNYAANQKCNMTSHIAVVHRKEKRYSCPHCEYTAGQIGSLKSHIAAIHKKENPFTCSQCQYITAYRYDLKMHITSVHRREKPYACPHCEYAACRKSFVTRHIASVHKAGSS